MNTFMKTDTLLNHASIGLHVIDIKDQTKRNNGCVTYARPDWMIVVRMLIEYICIH